MDAISKLTTGRALVYISLLLSPNVEGADAIVVSRSVDLVSEVSDCVRVMGPYRATVRPSLPFLPNAHQIQISPLTVTPLGHGKSVTVTRLLL